MVTNIQDIMNLAWLLQHNPEKAKEVQKLMCDNSFLDDLGDDLDMVGISEDEAEDKATNKGSEPEDVSPEALEKQKLIPEIEEE